MEIKTPADGEPLSGESGYCYPAVVRIPLTLNYLHRSLEDGEYAKELIP